MSLSWYWHRLRAMSAAELALRARKKMRQVVDARRTRDWASIKLTPHTSFETTDDGLPTKPSPPSPLTYPALPSPHKAPQTLRDALSEEAEKIMRGHWRAFGHLDLRVDDPPHWHKDYLSGTDLSCAQSAFTLNHRELPSGADIKLIWELSRWHHLTRLAMASWMFDNERAAGKVVLWLEDWVKHNQPFRGWNWTSALESGLRLIQFTWMDALLASNAERWNRDTELDTLRYEILPAHAWFTWRHRSFGSSANNHLIGELAGLITATARWPGLEHWAAPLPRLQQLWEREVLEQFASDGGNKEQALNYHLFSLELCLHARSALLARGRSISKEVESRMDAAIRFYWDVQADREHWDYGDSDDAYILPLILPETHYRSEWRRWMGPAGSPALDYWLGPPPITPGGVWPSRPQKGQSSIESGIASDVQQSVVSVAGTATRRAGQAMNRGTPLHASVLGEWRWYDNSGIALCESGEWWLRWDLSPLGYLSTAAHGHLDALHLSVWVKGTPLVVDPGTGAYFGDAPLREWLASRAAHNSPCPEGPQWPKRVGPFLWEQQHSRPEVSAEKGAIIAALALNSGKTLRKIALQGGGAEVCVEDSYALNTGAPGPFSVTWQFAPGTWIQRLQERKFVINRNDVSMLIEATEAWSGVELVEPSQRTEVRGQRSEDTPSDHPSPLTSIGPGLVSPGFRTTTLAPYLKLTARPAISESCVFRTTFVASTAS